MLYIIDSDLAIALHSSYSPHFIYTETENCLESHGQLNVCWSQYFSQVHWTGTFTIFAQGAISTAPLLESV